VGGKNAPAAMVVVDPGAGVRSRAVNGTPAKVPFSVPRNQVTPVASHDEHGQIFSLTLVSTCWRVRCRCRSSSLV
jgi:hypothetical protein